MFAVQTLHLVVNIILLAHTTSLLTNTSVYMGRAPTGYKVFYLSACQLINILVYDFSFYLDCYVTFIFNQCLILCVSVSLIAIAIGEHKTLFEWATVVMVTDLIEVRP